MPYDLLVVGSGFYGAVFAQAAAEAGKSVLVLERRGHVGGNSYSYRDAESNTLVHQYGTHIFHTNDEKIWAYANRFTRFNTYRHRVLTVHGSRVFSMPINLGTINAFFGLNLRPSEATAFFAQKRRDIPHPKNLEEKALSLVGRELYEAFIRGYTQKQWGRDPRELPASIITRLPVRTTYNADYFDDRFQGIPEDGYTPWFERMLAGVQVECNVDYLADRDWWRRQARTIVYTGPIDRYFDDCHGRLGWRSVRLEQERVAEDDWQGAAVMNYADAEVPFTRIHEFKHLHPECRHTTGQSLIFREYSLRDNDAPFYPINAPQDAQRLQAYQRWARQEPHVLFGGRLAEYRYYDMHQVIGAAPAAARCWLSGTSVEASRGAA